jgi:hypothetical protein
MKKITLILLLFVGNTVYAQHCSDTVKATNPSPFDWKQPQYSNIFVAPVNDIGPAVEIFPQFPFDYPGSDANINHFREDNPKDFSESEGWVLIKSNFGKSGVGNNGVTTPSFVMYNKYQSKLRVFFFLPRSLVNGQSFTKALITLRFTPTYNTESALLSNLKMPQKALDGFEKKQTATVVNAYENGGK